MTSPHLLANIARTIILIGQILNALFGLGIIGLLLASIVMGNRFTAMLLQLDVHPYLNETSIGMRCLMVIGILSAVAFHYMLKMLGRMAHSLTLDDPFMAPNASRLRVIGWALLALQVLDFPIIALRHYAPQLGNALPNSGISLSGWLAVLMVFVLAHIFEKGSAMRDYLAETI